MQNEKEHTHTFYVYSEENEDGCTSIFLVDTSVHTYLCSATPCFYIEQVDLKVPKNLTEAQEEEYRNHFSFYEGYISKYNLPTEDNLTHVIDVNDPETDCWEVARNHYQDNKDSF